MASVWRQQVAVPALEVQASRTSALVLAVVVRQLGVGDCGDFGSDRPLDEGRVAA